MTDPNETPLNKAAREYMAECMDMHDVYEDQEQNFILGHLVTFAARLEAALLAQPPREESPDARFWRGRVAWLEGTAMPHARRQENANGFQKGWHAALSRVSEGDDIAGLRALVPEPCANPDETLPQQDDLGSKKGRL